MPDGKKGNAAGLTPDQVKHIKNAISRATTLEEIERLNHMLRTGSIPGGALSNGAAKNGDHVEEMDED